MVMSRDVERIRLSFPVRPLEGLKFKLQVRGLKLLPQTYLEGMQLLPSMLFFVPGTVYS